MTTSPAVRVLPATRPEARTWLVGTARATPPTAPPPETPRPEPGRVEVAGRGWGVGPAAHLPDATRWAAWCALALAEAALGRRPATQLAGWVSPQVLAGLARRQRLRPAGPPAPRTVLLSGRVQHPAAQVAEVSAVLRTGARLLVLAFRLEGADGRWVCTALEAGLTPGRRAGASPRSPAAPAAAAPGPGAGTR
ncbi:Rv3235 family protein [Microlunatus flavus]|uniref:Rv3235 family protein n=1 Tax=Microlunatus flavus TaxID=1036181 RepID=UPI0011135965|nr:Rv3235 family protein [Microlunatus flavus]